MIRKSVLSVTGCGLILLIIGCGGSKPAAPEQETQSKMKIGLVTDVGKVDDRTFNQSAYEGMMKAAKDFNIHTAFIETMQPTDYEKNIRQFIDDGYGLIITVGFMLGDATKKVALENPTIKFAIIDFAYEPPIPNVLGLVFAENESGFLAGALAGMMTKTNKIGFIGGKEIPPVMKFRQGYEAGANHINNSIKVYGVYIDSFTDPARGRIAAESQIAEGADVLFGCGGTTGSGAIKAANEKQVFCIGVDTDEYLTTFAGSGAPYLLTSAMKRVDTAVYGAIKDYVTGQFQGGVKIGSAANQGIDLAPFHETESLIPEAIKVRLRDEIKKDLQEGRIKLTP